MNMILGAIDLTAVTDAIAELKTALLAAAAIAIAAGLAVFAVKFGGKWVVKVWKSFAS
jgi:hypothetical protein